ncbi:hypothetical protein KC19_10G106100 [Ceratodon purpureus]|uniref:Uncharacterized protein n=1 Tax=Ceratodon purpureus TaxID=3225 RepID=A0A8T0GMK7_CERPU|nr:hypothetical protein KC19_10G106100 [Ceratodon purpureus]
MHDPPLQNLHTHPSHAQSLITSVHVRKTRPPPPEPQIHILITPTPPRSHSPLHSILQTPFKLHPSSSPPVPKYQNPPLYSTSPFTTTTTTTCPTFHHHLLITKLPPPSPSPPNLQKTPKLRKSSKNPRKNSQKLEKNRKNLEWPGVGWELETRMMGKETG